MPSFKGNAGHLMQHWPLCEMLRIAATHKDVTGLNFIDAYAMAPLATENAGKDAKFQRAEARLPNLGKAASAYERAWYKLTSGHCPEPREGYPNSAAFVEQVWKGDFSMLLCEIDRATCREIKPWLQSVDNSDSCKATELFPGDWRERFRKGLPHPADVELADGSLTLVLFDPIYVQQTPEEDERWESLLLRPRGRGVQDARSEGQHFGTTIHVLRPRRQFPKRRGSIGEQYYGINRFQVAREDAH